MDNVQNISDHTELYNRKTVDYGNGICDVTAYRRPQTVFRNCGSKSSIRKEPAVSDEQQLQRTMKQIHAIKRKIRGYALANSFRWFATLTLNPDITDRFSYDSAKDTLLRWCRSMRNRYGRFDYLIVPELHKNGAVHFHALISNLPAGFVTAVNSETQKPVIRNSRQVYNLTDWKYGFSECELVEDQEKTASYLTKYITKDLISDKSMFRKKRYFNSQGLKKPTVALEMKDNAELDIFTPNFGIIDTDSNGQNVIDVGLYRLKKHGDRFIQTDTDYLMKAKSMKQ